MQMTEACNRIGTPEHSAVLQAQVVGQGVAQALAALQIVPQKPQPQENIGPSFNCGNYGHFKRETTCSNQRSRIQ